jgi:hypothetical protein
MTHQNSWCASALWVMLLGLCACQSLAEPPASPVVSPWQTLHSFSADYLSAPALLWRTSAEAPFLAWGASDADGKMRHYIAQANSNPRILALDARLPMQHQLYPASAEQVHLLWLDLSPERDGLRLYHALVGQDLVAKVGINTISTQATGDYHAIALEQGALLVAWTQGSIGAQTLQLTLIDAQGRVFFAERVARSASQPSFVRLPDDSLRLLWQAENVIWQVELFREGQAWRWSIPEIYAPIPERLPETYQQAFYSASDSTHRYLFWQFVPSAGTPYTVWTSAPHSAPSAPAPQRLSFVANSANTLDTLGYNGGIVQTARLGRDDVNRRLVTWARPIESYRPAHNLSLAIQDAEAKLAILYLQEGEIVGLQELASAGTLTDAPRLVVSLDGRRHLALAWSVLSAPRGQIYASTTLP